MPTMDHQMTDLAKSWADWSLKIKDRAKELEEKGHLKAALDFNFEAQAIMANNFPSFLDTSPSTSSSGSVPRLAPAPISQQHQININGNGNGTGNGNGNGNGAGLNGMPMAAGQQADVNFLFQKLVELSEVLKENREKTAGVIAGAEELATRAAAKGASPSLQEANAEVSSQAARIADLERQLSREQNKTRILMDEQKENIKLIGEYEHHLGEIVKDVRDFSYNTKTRETSIARHYNKLLQDEKDAHLAARLEKDDWHAKFMRTVEMLREAYRLRCEEEEVPIRVIAGLQNEVRAYRSCLGMEAEKPEEEFGWEILKDIPNGGGEP